MQFTQKEDQENSNKIAFTSQLTMAINGPNEVPNTNTTIKPSLTKFLGEKSQTFTPKILSCFSAIWQGQKSIFNQICPLLHVYRLIGWGGIHQCF